MATPEEIELRRRRRAWWIAAARRTDPRSPTLVAVALAVGLKEKSASTVSDWENNIGGGPSIEQLERLAAFYELPLSTFTEPAETDQDRLDRLRRLALAAVELATEDLEPALEPHRGADEGRAAEPRTRSA